MAEADAQLPLVHLKSIGCRTNQEELITLRAQLQQAGYEFTEDIAQANIVIINTCAVTAHTESKTRRMLQTIAEQYPHAKICVTGCLAQQQPENLASLKGIHWVIGNTEKQIIPGILSEHHHGIFHACFSEHGSDLNVKINEIPVPAPEGSLRTRFSIKIQEGCDYRCAYCIVPQVRGPARSFRCNEILDLCKRAIDAGYHELILTGTHIGQYRDLNGGFLQLLLKISGLDGDFRVRLSSLDPRDLTEELFDLIGTHPKICDHLHVSVQHFDRTVLKMMGRDGADPNLVIAQLKLFRERYPSAGLGADIIVGFPGETERQFESMLQAVEQTGFSYAHVFRYSVRPGTAAEHMPGTISEKEKALRSERLRAVIAASRKIFINQCIGNPQRIIVESEEPVRGLTSNYLHVELDNSRAAYNSWLDITITGFDNGRYFPALPV
jgi:threonylcarbamoyladenosine tRNA methylthiotransferase MtaB